MLVKNAENYINRLKKMIIARFGNIETAITHDDDCDMHAVQISFLLNGKYSWVCAYDDDDVITYYVSGKGHTKEMTIEDTQVKSMYKVLDKVEDLAYETDIEATETSESSKIEEATEDYNEYEEILDSKESTEHDRINYLMETHSTPTINFEYRNLMYTDEYKAAHPEHNEMSLPCRVCTHFCTRFDTENYRMEYCCRKNKENEKKAIKNLEWHHVNLNTLANLDFDMLDEKRQLYLKLYRELKELIEDLHKCKSGRAYERRLAKMYIRNAELFDENKISHDYINYVTRKISMCNVECGLWTSRVEEATGLHKSRRYNMHTLRY
mgnify:CR=1 FL=1|jgi:hypothetical protein